MEQQQNFTRGPILSALLKFALPVLLALQVLLVQLAWLMLALLAWVLPTVCLARLQALQIRLRMRQKLLCFLKKFSYSDI